MPTQYLSARRLQCAASVRVHSRVGVRVVHQETREVVQTRVHNAHDLVLACQSCGRVGLEPHRAALSESPNLFSKHYYITY